MDERRKMASLRDAVRSGSWIASPRELWTLVFLAGTIAALVYGARLLLLPGT
jgi:hypothetical protein